MATKQTATTTIEVNLATSRSVPMTEKQQALLARLRASQGLYLRGAEVRVCRALVAKGEAKLEDNGAMRGDTGRDDGQRWWAEALPVAPSSS